MNGKVLAVTALAIASVAGAAAQTAPAPEFEAVSIKAAPPPTGMGISVVMRGGPGSSDPGRLDWNNVSIKQMVGSAFNVKDYQIEGPEWMNSERFNVMAKVPARATKEQYRLMIQKMLADRFGMKFHHETKDHPAYALVVAKGGSKLKASDPNDTSGLEPMPMRGPNGEMRASAPPPPPLPSGVKAGAASPERGGMMMMGPGHAQAKRTTADGLATLLANLVGRPVVNQTDLKGNFDFTLDYAPDSAAGMPGGMGMMMAGGPMGGGNPAPQAAEPSTGLSIYAAVQQQLGLRLEPKKLPLEDVVIEHIEKVPTEN